MSRFAIYRSIPLTQGKVAWVDNADYADLKQFNWHADRKRGEKIYAARNCSAGPKEYMHRRILGLTPGDSMVADHINSNGLDNRRCNLRTCAAAQNSANTTKPHSRHEHTSRFKGVSFAAASGLWRAQIGSRESHRHLGYFKSEHMAAAAYNEAAVEMFGEFAKLNDLDSLHGEETTRAASTAPITCSFCGEIFQVSLSNLSRARKAKYNICGRKECRRSALDKARSLRQMAVA